MSSRPRDADHRVAEQRNARLRGIAFIVAIISVIPYVTMKVLWLAGSQIGMRAGAGVGELHDGRFVIGNVITVVLSAVAVLFAFALRNPARRLVPDWLVIFLGAGACGVLAPIAVGLPLGVVLQLLVQGTARTGGEGNLSGAVFATVYGGFAVLGIAIAFLLASYALDRWRVLLSRPPHHPSRWVTAICGVGMLAFSAAMIIWGVTGPGTTGPPGFAAIEQRTVLVVNGVLAAAGFLAPLVRGRFGRHPRLLWLITWTGCSTAALQGPTLIALAHGGIIRPAVLVLTVLATPAAAAYGLAVLHRSRDLEGREFPSPQSNPA